MSKPPSPHSVVLVFDTQEKTVCIEQAIVSHESIEITAVFSNGTNAPINSVVSKELIASKLGRREAAAKELLESLAIKLQHQEGDVLLSREEVQRLLDKAGESNVVHPFVLEESALLPEGVAYEDPASAAGECEITIAAFNAFTSEREEETVGKPTINLLVSEEDVA